MAEWKDKRLDCLAAVEDKPGAGPWIVRSSCSREDSEMGSNAGAFLSIPNVETAGLILAIEKVIASYDKAQPADEVLIQPMLTGVLRSGVAFTHDPNTSAPYRVVNWSEGSDTAAVTGGLGGRMAAGSSECCHTRARHCPNCCSARRVTRSIQ